MRERDTERKRGSQRDRETEREITTVITFRMKSRILCLPPYYKQLPLYCLIIANEELQALLNPTKFSDWKANFRPPVYCYIMKLAGNEIWKVKFRPPVYHYIMKFGTKNNMLKRGKQYAE